MCQQDYLVKMHTDLDFVAKALGKETIIVGSINFGKGNVFDTLTVGLNDQLVDIIGCLLDFMVQFKSFHMSKSWSHTNHT